jgi:hypothetical protein
MEAKADEVPVFDIPGLKKEITRQVNFQKNHDAVMFALHDRPDAFK